MGHAKREDEEKSSGLFRSSEEGAIFPSGGRGKEKKR